MQSLTQSWKCHSSTPFGKMITKTEMIFISKTISVLCVATSEYQVAKKNNPGVICLRPCVICLWILPVSIQILSLPPWKRGGRLIKIFLEMHTNLLIISFSSYKKKVLFLQERRIFQRVLSFILLQTFCLCRRYKQKHWSARFLLSSLQWFCTCKQKTECKCNNQYLNLIRPLQPSRYCTTFCVVMNKTGESAFWKQIKFWKQTMLYRGILPAFLPLLNNVKQPKGSTSVFFFFFLLGSEVSLWQKNPPTKCPIKMQWRGNKSWKTNFSRSTALTKDLLQEKTCGNH